MFEAVVVVVEARVAFVCFGVEGAWFCAALCTPVAFRGVHEHKLNAKQYVIVAQEALRGHTKEHLPSVHVSVDIWYYFCSLLATGI